MAYMIWSIHDYHVSLLVTFARSLFEANMLCWYLQAGDNVGLLMRGLKRDDVERGQVGESLQLTSFYTG